MVGLVPCRLERSRDVKQVEHKDIDYEKPEIIMEKVLELEGEIAGDIEEIKN